MRASAPAGSARNAGSRVRFSVLGPLEVRLDDATVEVRRGIPRVLLCALLLRRGDVISADTLIEHAWGDSLPANPANSLQTHVAYLRKKLGGPSTAPLVTRVDGYAIDVPSDAVDSYRFERLIDETRGLIESGTQHSLEQAVAALDVALAMWRGEAYHEVADRTFAQGEAARLTEIRLQAIHRRIDALLGLGRAEDAVRDLTVLVDEQPLRERFHEQLVLALYRSGRQAEALRAYERARYLLAEELGLDPGPGLRRLERLVLEQSEELEWRAPASSHGLRSTAGTNDQGSTTGLPTPGDPLVGRADEVERVQELLGRTRLLTLTGPGGSGKTRLAFEIARGMADERPVHVIDLGSVQHIDAVGLTVAAALGVDVPVDDDVDTALAAGLAGSDVLLVLDTCEHVVSAAARLTSVVNRRAPDVTVLATSRRPLGVSGELAWPVPPLRLPAPGEDPRNSAAVDLFVQRASATSPELQLNDDVLSDIAEICRALDGLPLAIELAAAQSDVLDPSAIRARLADRFSLLIDANEQAPPRQRTLLATLEWSVDLLSDDQRELLGRLAVFVGSFDLDGAAAIAHTDRPTAIAAVLELVRSSLVVPAGGDRYRLLDTVRSYAIDHLGPPSADVARAHAAHLCDVAEAAFTNVRSPAQAASLARARIELGNLRAALDWSFSPGGDPHVGARLAGLVAWIWTLDGLLTEARRALDRAATVIDAPPEVRARVLLGIGLLAAPLGDLATALETCAEGAAIAEETGDLAMAADLRITLGVAQWGLGDLAAAAVTHDEAVRLFDDLGDAWGATVARLLRARTAIETGEFEVAERILDVALDDARATGDAHVLGLAFDQHAQLALALGDLPAAAMAARECLAQNESIGYAEGVCGALHVLGRVRTHQGLHDDARALHLRALDHAARIRHVGATCEALEDLATLAAARGDDDEASLLLLHASRHRNRRGVPLRPLDAERIAALETSVRERMGERWAATANQVRLTALDDVVRDLLEPGGSRPGSEARPSFQPMSSSVSAARRRVRP